MNLVCTAACAIASLLSMGNLLKKQRSPSNFLFAGLAGVVALILGLSAARYGADPWLTGPPTFALSLLALYGILICLLFFSLVQTPGEKKSSHRLAFLLLIPAALSDVLVYGFHFQQSNILIFRQLIHGLYVGVGVAVVGFCIASGTHVFRLYFPRAMTKAAWTILTISVTSTMAFLIGLVGLFVTGIPIFPIMDGFLSLMVVAAALLDFRYPDALCRFQEDTVKRRYARSLLIGLDIEGLRLGMIAMMEKTKVYRDEKFSLRLLSERMGLSTHQVSELLNDRMGTNFSSFTNRFRVEDAKLLLISQPNMTTLAVAMEVGFGNKTSFNEAFRRQVHMTPRQFRESASKTVQIDRS